MEYHTYRNKYIN